jgi:hypothetical protein
MSIAGRPDFSESRPATGSGETALARKAISQNGQSRLEEAMAMVIIIGRDRTLPIETG